MTTYSAQVSPLRIYDNGGRSFDRYTIIPPRSAHKKYKLKNNGFADGGGLWYAIGASANPYHPQGFGMYVDAQPGPHLGKRVQWSDLPADVQSFAREAFPEYAPAAETVVVK